MREFQNNSNSSRAKRSRSAIEESAWDCSFCTYRNRHESFKCEMCYTRKGTSTRKPRLTQFTQQFAKIENQIEQERNTDNVSRKEATPLAADSPSVTTTTSSSSPGKSNKANRHRSTDVQVHSKIGKAQTISITVEGVTVIITDYELASTSASAV